MAQQWLVSKDGQTEIGPFPSEQLRRMVDSGELKPNDRIRPQGVDRWALAKQIKGLFGASNSSPGIKLPTSQTPPPFAAAGPQAVSEANPFAFDDSPPEPPRSSRSKEKRPDGSNAEDSPDPSRPRSKVRSAEPIDDDEPPRTSKKSSPSGRSDSKPGFDRKETPSQQTRAAPPVASSADDNPFSFSNLAPATPTPRRPREDSSSNEKDKDETRRRGREIDDEDDDKPRRPRRDEDDEDEQPKPKSTGGVIGKLGANRRETTERKPNRARDVDDEETDENDPPRRRGRDDDDDEKPRSARREIEELKERKATGLQKTGEYDEYEYARCWNGIEEVGLNPDELLLFCTTRSRHEVATGSKLAGFFTGKKAAEPLYHLAVFRSEIVLLYAPEEGPVQAIRCPFVTLDWQFLQGDEIAEGMLSQDTDLFSTESKEKYEDEKRTVILTLKSSSHEVALRLFRGSQTKSLRESFVKQLMKQAEAMFQEGRYVLAERCLDRIPEETSSAPDAAKLRERLGIRAAVVVDYRRGHPQLISAARGLLRLDALGLEFFVESTALSIRVLDEDLQLGSELRKGRFPLEYAQQIAAERKAAKSEFALASGSSSSATLVMRNNAEARIEAAKKRFKAAKFGSAFKNRLATRVHLPTSSTTLIFDVAGSDREATQKQAVAFHAILKRSGKASSTRKKRAPQLVGCPGCRATLRVQVMGVVQCPRCQVKVRVPQTESGT